MSVIILHLVGPLLIYWVHHYFGTRKILFFFFFFFPELDDDLDKANKEQKELQNKLEYWKVGLQSCMSHVIRKPVYAICEQQRRRSAWASAQSDQHFC